MERILFFIISLLDCTNLTEALIRQSNDTRRWLQLAEIQIQLENAEAAERAHKEAIARSDENIPAWQINLSMAQWWSAQNLDLAEFYGVLALKSAPPDAAVSVRQLMDQIAAERARQDE